MEAIADLIIKEIVKIYNPFTNPIWFPERIKFLVNQIGEDIAKTLDYTDANLFVKSLQKEINIDITSIIVENKFPVWIDLEKKETKEPLHDNLVITYIDKLNDDTQRLMGRIEEYAKKIDADFVLLSGRTQGYIQLEKHRIKEFAQLYNRTIYFNPNVFIKEDCPNLFDICPKGKIGIYSENQNNGKYLSSSKYFLLRRDAFSRLHMITGDIEDALLYEFKQMDTNYDDSVIVFDKEHCDIWNPFTFCFDFRDSQSENAAWIEILIYRNGYTVFPLSKDFNQNVLDQNLSTWKILHYDRLKTDQNIVYTWLDDNNVIGYKDKDPINMLKFKILSLYHKEEQKNSIQNRSYLEFVSLNDMALKFDNSFTESRIYYEDFDYLFPEKFEYVGLTTGSWNLKYIGINPIDQLHNWSSIRRLDENTVLCADTETTNRFFRERKCVLQNVFSNITLDMIKEFLQLIKLPIEYEEKRIPVSNQIIAKRSIVKSLFDFYQSNEILDKIAFFMNKYELKVKENAYGGDAYRRRSGFFAETATALWFNQNDFTIMPQETLRQDWYKR